MNKEELHSIVQEQQPNICQIAAIKDNDIIYSDTWNDYKTTDNVHIASVTKSIRFFSGLRYQKGRENNPRSFFISFTYNDSTI